MKHTRESVIDRTKRECQQLDRLVRKVRPADWNRLVPRPESRDPWTVKDSLAHIAYWKEHSARVVRGEKRLPEMRGLEVDAINAIVYQRWRRRQPADVVAYHRQTQAEVLQSLRAKPEAWFTGKDRGAGWPADFDGHSAWHRVRDMEGAIKS
jgi:hypothetical protein